jgi:hypothetical protein
MIDARNLFILNYLGRNVWKLSLQGRFLFLIMNYQGFWNNQVNLYDFSSTDWSSNENSNYREISNFRVSN